MKRKITLLALVLVVVILATSVLFACNDGLNGRYYLYEDGIKNENSWIDINGKKWIDDAGEGGKIEQNEDGSYNLYDQNGELFCNAKINDGVLVLDLLLFTIEYRKDGAMGSVGDSTQVGNSQVDENAKVTAIQGGTVDGLTILLDVGPEVTDVELSGMLTVSKNSSWQLYADKMGQTLIPTKYATNLSAGDNLYYVVVNSEDGSINRTYTLSIHKQYYTNIYLKANDITIKTIEDVLTHTMVELNPPSEMEGYYLTWSTTSYYVAESNKVIEASSTTPKTHTVRLNTEGGTLTGEATHTLTYDAEYTLPVPTRKGYTFVGWKCNGNIVTNANGASISNFRFDENVNYYADWSLNYYTLNVRSNDTSLGTVNEVSGEKAYGSNVTLVATPKTNCYFKGWYKNSISGSKVSNNLSYTITMEDSSATYVAKFVCYTLTTSTNLTGAGTYSSYNNKKMPLDKDITLTATTYAGYTWLGWYDGETKVSEGTSLTYTFTMGEESKTYTAKWMSCPITLTKNISSAGSVSGVSGATAVGAQTTITAITNAGYTWLGWYDGETKVSEGTNLTYTFTMGTESKTYTAKWELCTSHTLDSNCVCTKCNLAVHNIVGGVCEDCGETVYTRDGSYIYFGTYPQSEVTNSTLKSTLTGSAGALPTSSNNGNWTSYGYYISGSVRNYMWYIDKEYEGEKYRGVYFTSYRPYEIYASSSTSNSKQDDNGYSTGNVYWFKYEPIKWRILSEGSGKALILAELILDSQEFYPSTSSHTEKGTTVYANNWEYSTIRKWLNETFYNVAFNDLQKALIVATELDNKTTAYNGSSNSYATCQNNTTDKVFLLSYRDILKTSYGFNASSVNYDTARRKKTSDYAQAQGAYTSTESSYLGNGEWWLRSPYDSSSYDASRVLSQGYVAYYYYVIFTNQGVVPALTIML